MRQLKLLSMIALLLGFGPASVKAQENVLSSGATIISNDGWMSYSLGQLTYHAYAGSTGSIGEGVQQSIVISIVSEPVVSGIEDKIINLSAYPNPANDWVTLDIDDPDGHITASLYDLSGLLVKTFPIISSQTLMDLTDLKESIYLLRVSRRKGHLRTFRIIKN